MRRKIFVIGIFIIITAIIGYFVYDRNDDTIDNEYIVMSQEEKSESLESNSNKNDNKDIVMVDIKGAVKKPGVYEVSSNNRVIDVIKTAGGLKSNANTNYINLSSKVKDEMVIWIYTNKEISELNLKQSSTKYMVEKCNCPTIDNTTCLNSNTNKSNSNDTNVKNNTNIVNINTATIDELMTLDGVGESKAKSIIEYRTKSGSFKVVGDIMNVSGIGEALYNKIKDHITV